MKERIRLFLRPRGGSYVIFTPRMRRVTGKTLEGIDVNQIRKSELVSAAGWLHMVSWILSNWGMNDGAKWQFWSSTHLPSLTANFIAFSAISPYPWPKLRELKVFLNPSFSARVVISRRGSAPDERMKISGVKASASLKACSRLKGGGSMYALPISLMIRF